MSNVNVKVINNAIFGGFVGKLIDENGSKVVVEVNDESMGKFSIHLSSSEIEHI